MNGLIEFFKNAEKLHSEARTTELSSGGKESVSSHSWMLSLMAIVFLPKLKARLDLTKVLELCTVHDLAESVVHDIPLHQQMKNTELCKTKHDCEKRAIVDLANLSGNKELISLWQEYESRQTPEAKFVKQLDLLEVDLQIMCSASLTYVAEYDNGIYWKIYFSENRAKPFEDEPVLMAFFLQIRKNIEARLKAELNINPDVYKGLN